MQSEIKFYADRIVGDKKGWYWVSHDEGAWSGPKSDWENHHSLIINELVTNKRVVIQAGGNQGMYPRMLSSIFDTVYTFEPDFLNYQTLIKNVPDNVFHYRAAIGYEVSLCRMHHVSNDNLGMHQTIIDKESVIPVITLDSVLGGLVNSVGLIMLDLEGYEYNALLGSIKILTNNRPVIFIERPNKEVIDLLDGLGYKMNKISAMDTVFTHNEKEIRKNSQ